MAASEIDRLIDQVKEAAASDRNQQRGKEKPFIGIGIEVPIAWTIIFDYDCRRAFEDPEFYVAQTLRQKLWAFENINDDTPITADMPLWLGHYPEYTFFGMSLGVNARGMPLLDFSHPITRDPDLKYLEPIDFMTAGMMPHIMSMYEQIGGIIDGRLPCGFITWNRGGLDLAIQLRGYNDFILDTMERPEFVHALMGRVTEERCKWYDALAEWSGNPLGPTGVADDWINVPYISPHIFEEFLLPRYLEIEAHHGAILSLHSCGDQTPIQKYMLQVKSLNYFEVSPWTDLAQTVENVPADKYSWHRSASQRHPRRQPGPNAGEARVHTRPHPGPRVQRRVLGPDAHPRPVPGLSDADQHLARPRP